MWGLQQYCHKISVEYVQDYKNYSNDSHMQYSKQLQKQSMLSAVQ